MSLTESTIMKDLEQELIALLQYQEALTIIKLKDGWMISFSELEQDDEGIIFIPNKVMLSTQPLVEALFEFHQQKEMGRVKGFQA